MFVAGLKHFLVVVVVLISDANVYSKIRPIIASAYNSRKFVYTQHGAELSFNEIWIDFLGEVFDFVVNLNNSIDMVREGASPTELMII